MSTKGSSLPCKKRKASHDSASLKQGLAGNNTSTYSIPGQHGRKESSQGSTSTTDFVAQSLRRKYSQDCSLPVDDLPDCSSILNLKPAAVTTKTAVTGAGEASLLEEQANRLVSLDVLMPSSTKSVTAATVAADLGGEASSHDDTFASSGHRLLMEAIMMKTVADSTAAAAESGGGFRDRIDSIYSFEHQRNRLESWGGMSELSFTGNNNNAVDVVFPASNFTPAVDDSVPTRILLPRSRLDSLASEANNKSNDDHASENSSATENMQQTIQAYVAAAMATVGDELRDLAGIIEHVASEALEDDFFQLHNNHDDANSFLVSSLRPRSQSVSSAGKLSVDLDAVQAAVDAGEAASQTLGLKDLPEFPQSSSSGPHALQQHKKPAFAKRQLPLTKTRDRTGSQTSNDSKGSSIPLKKRAKRPSTDPAADTMKTPKISNAAKRKRTTPDTARSSATKNTNSGALSARGEDRWEVMYEYLLQFAAMKRHDATKDMAEPEAKQWVWDGNVQTTYTTPDGTKLGRWVNNQRTAKQKGKLRPDREEKLIAAGLRWFVIPPDAWDDMFAELKVYIATKTADGSTWDGNVPTNYQITGRTWQNNGTDKNLGRWVNRQRDMYQNGKLKKARREKLEQLGLKWPKGAVTWDEMMQLLEDYAEQQRRTVGAWDGHVDVSHQTKGDPPRMLGKWVSRQKSARVKKKLSKTQEEQLTNLGLQWDVNETATTRKSTGTTTQPPTAGLVAVASKPDDIDPMQVVSISMALLGE